MRDPEFARDFEDIRAYALQHPQRLNALLDLKMLDGSRAEM